jgi:hypothetical protein
MEGCRVGGLQICRVRFVAGVERGSGRGSGGDEDGQVVSDEVVEEPLLLRLLEFRHPRGYWLEFEMTQPLSGGWTREGFDSSVYATVLHLHVDIIEGFLEIKSLRNRY